MDIAIRKKDPTIQRRKISGGCGCAGDDVALNNMFCSSAQDLFLEIMTSTWWSSQPPSSSSAATAASPWSWEGQWPWGCQRCGGRRGDSARCCAHGDDDDDDDDDDGDGDGDGDDDDTDTVSDTESFLILRLILLLIVHLLSIQMILKLARILILIVMVLAMMVCKVVTFITALAWSRGDKQACAREHCRSMGP